MTNSGAVTVMGSDVKYTHIHSTHILTPPYLTKDTDHPGCGEDLREWMQKISDCNEGEDTRAKGAAVTLKMFSYSSLQIAQKEKVKEAVR